MEQIIVLFYAKALVVKGAVPQLDWNAGFSMSAIVK